MTGTVWACLALALPLLALLSLQLLRFHFSLDAQTPAIFTGSLGVSFLWFRRELKLGGERALSGANNDRASGAVPFSHKGQRGGLSIPEAWIEYFIRLKRRARAAALKWALDFRVWGHLCRFVLKSGNRVLGLLHPTLEYLQVGMEDVYALSRIASIWSVLSGALPALACPTEFRFAAKSFILRVKLGGGFTGLHALRFGIAILFSFPWIPLGSRFLHSWRDPSLNRWQRRLLLP